MSKLDAKIPDGPLVEKWDRHRFNMKLVNPANRRQFTVLVVGTGLAGASAMLFTSAKISQLALLPQGRLEAKKRVLAMLGEMDRCGFGNCTNHRVCEAACPKQVSIRHIARFNREFLKAGFS